MAENWVSRSVKKQLAEDKRTLAQAGKDKRFGRVMGFDEDSIEYVKENQEKLSKKYGTEYIMVEKTKIIGHNKRLQELVDSLGSQTHLRMVGRGIVIGKIEGIVRYDPCQTVKLCYNPAFALRDLEMYSRYLHSSY